MSLLTTSCMSNETLTVMFVMLFALVIYIIGKLKRIRIISIAGGMTFFIASLFLMSCSMIIALLFAVAGALMAVQAAVS